MLLHCTDLYSGLTSVCLWHNDKPQGLPLRESSWRRMFCRDLFTGFIRIKVASEKRVPIVVNNRVDSRLNHRHIFVSDPPNLKPVQSLDTFTQPLSSHWTIFRLITEHQIHDPRLPIINPHVFCSVILCSRVQSLSPFAGWICMAVCLRDAFSRTTSLKGSRFGSPPGGAGYARSVPCG